MFAVPLTKTTENWCERMTDKRKIKIIPLLLAVLCLLCSCGKKENEPFDIEKCVSPNININRMFLKKYSQDEIEKL